MIVFTQKLMFQDETGLHEEVVADSGGKCVRIINDHRKPSARHAVGTHVHDFGTVPGTAVVLFAGTGALLGRGAGKVQNADAQTGDAGRRRSADPRQTHPRSQRLLSSPGPGVPLRQRSSILARRPRADSFQSFLDGCRQGTGLGIMTAGRHRDSSFHDNRKKTKNHIFKSSSKILIR